MLHALQPQFGSLPQSVSFYAKRVIHSIPTIYQQYKNKNHGNHLLLRKKLWLEWTETKQPLINSYLCELALCLNPSILEKNNQIQRKEQLILTARNRFSFIFFQIVTAP